MAAKARGIRVRKTRSGQLEWTMAKPEKKPGWQLTKTGKIIENAKKAASAIVGRAMKDKAWAKANKGVFLFCLYFVRNRDGKLPSQNIQTPQNAREILRLRNEIRKKETKAQKEVNGQQSFDFGSAEIPF
ncbi:MAG: hypothetical protein V1777_04820 [Candidatus Micrarchaeota archaeon]